MLRNFLMLSQSGLQFDSHNQEIFSYVEKFVGAHNHVPEYSTIVNYFDSNNKTDVKDHLATLAALTPKYHGDFVARIETLAEQARKRKWAEILSTAQQIANTGITVKKRGVEQFLQGPVASAKFVAESSHDVITPTLSSKLSGEITGDGVDFTEEYLRIEADPLAGVGQHTGIEQMDSVLGGAKKYELWTHAAFTGHFKSTLMVNWAYNQAVWYKYSSLIFSLEMPYNQIRRILFAIHSSHEKFKEIRQALGLDNPNGGLEYKLIRDALLSEAEKEFLLKYVVPDFDDPANGYGKIHIRVADPDKMDFTSTDLKAQAELLYSQDPFRTIFIDHAGLMASRTKYNSTTESTNEVMRDLKKIALGFNRGAGMALVALFQINREGFKTAMKRLEKGGQASYQLTDLAYANECEKSSDVVTAGWIDDDLRARNRLQMQCLKTRDSEPFETFLIRTEMPWRRFLTCYDLILTGEGKRSVGDVIDGELMALE
jgi:replicative DNA helicase